MTASSLQPMFVFFAIACSEQRQTELVDLIVPELPNVDVRIVADVASTIQVRTHPANTNSLRIATFKLTNTGWSFLTRCGGQRRTRFVFPWLIQPMSRMASKCLMSRAERWNTGERNKYSTTSRRTYRLAYSQPSRSKTRSGYV